MAPSELPRCTKLTFAGGQQAGEPIRFSTLARIREPVSRSKSGVHGKVADVQHVGPGTQNLRTKSEHSKF
jgi:hypothetical protein